MSLLRHLNRDHGKVYRQAAVLLALLTASFWLDGMVADYLARPIQSGQLKGVLRAMRCWGEGATLIVLTVAIWLADRRNGKKAVLILLLALISGGVVDIIKPLVARPRPDRRLASQSQRSPTQTEPAARLVEGALLQVEGMLLHVEDMLHWIEDSSQTGRNSSFPSGHSAAAFAYARGVSLLCPAIRPVCLVAASGTALSRMYDQRHYLSDCICGALIGWYLSWLCWIGAHRLADNLAARSLPKGTLPSPATILGRLRRTGVSGV